MRHFILFLIFNINLFYCFAQVQPVELKNRYESLDISKISGRTLKLININLLNNAKNDYMQLVQAKQKDFYNRIKLDEKPIQDQYTSLFSKALLNTRTDFLKNDVLWKIPSDYYKDYGLDVLSKYRSVKNSSKYIDEFLVPALQAGFQAYGDSVVNATANTILNDAQRFRSIISASTSYLKEKGVTAQTSILDIQRTLNGVALSIARVEDKVAYSEEAVEILAQKSKQALIENSVSVVSRPQRKLENQYKIFLRDIDIKVKDNFRELGDSFQQLSKNEIVVQETVMQLRNTFNDVQAKIKDKENALIAARTGTNTFLQLQIEHTTLVAQNQLRLNVINEYVNKGAQVINTALTIKNTVDKVFSGNERTEFLNKLKNFELPTISAAISVAGQAASVIRNAFPNSAAAQQVAKFVGYANAAVSIAQGVAGLFTGNPLGVLSCLSGLQSIFGGPPPESAELQMLKKMMAFMQDSFKEVNARLDRIERKLDGLIVLVQDMYKDVMQSFQFIADKLDEIKREIDVIDQRTLLLIQGDLNFCKLTDEVRQRAFNRDSLHFTKYENYVDLGRSNDCKKCLDALGKYTLEGNNQFLTLSTSEAFDLTDPIVNKVYKPTRTLFLNFFTNNVNNALSCLMIPSQNISNTGKSLSAIGSVQEATPFKITDLDKYYNYDLISRIVNYLEFFGIFWEIEEQNLTPYSSVGELMLAPNLEIKKDNLFLRLTSMLNVVNQAILQQSLLSGNLMIERTYQTLFADNPNKVNVKESVDVLEFNKLFAKNFSSRLALGAINGRGNAIDDPARFDLYTELFFAARVDNNKLVELQNNFNDVSGFYRFERPTGQSNIVIRIKTPLMDKEIDLPLPDPSFVLSNEMAQSSGFYALLKAKEQIVNMIIDLNFSKELKKVNGENGITFDDWKYMYSGVAR